jgi:hypothetical protein
MNRKIIDHSTAGGASWGSQLAPGSFYLVANLRESNRTKTKPKNHLHSYLYKTGGKRADFIQFTPAGLLVGLHLKYTGFRFMS